MITKLRSPLLAPLIVALALLLIGCSQASSPAGSRDVTIDQALTDWESGAVVILDVRTLSEYAAGHIPNALLIPLDQLPQRFHEVPTDKKVYVICRSGNRSSQAVSLLREKGLSNVYNVMAGMNAWKGKVVAGQ